MQKLTSFITPIVIAALLLMFAVITDSLRTIALNITGTDLSEMQNQVKEIENVITRYNDNFRRIQNTFEENGYSISTSTKGLTTNQ